jgi:hypothetical protein
VGEVDGVPQVRETSHRQGHVLVTNVEPLTSETRKEAQTEALQEGKTFPQT